MNPHFTLHRCLIALHNTGRGELLHSFVRRQSAGLLSLKHQHLLKDLATQFGIVEQKKDVNC